MAQLIVLLLFCCIFYPTLRAIVALVIVIWYFGWQIVLGMFMFMFISLIIVNTDLAFSTQTDKKQGKPPKLTREQQLCYRWATEHKFWRNSIRDEATFLKILNNPKVKLEKQYKNYLQKKEHESR